MILIKSCKYAEYITEVAKFMWEIFSKIIKQMIDEKKISMSLLWKLDGLEYDYDKLPKLEEVMK